MADDIARKSNCSRRRVGALLVRDREILATGWNGTVGMEVNCRDAGCPRCINGGPTGSGYENCICIHAEQRALGDAAKRGVSTEGCTLYVNLRPCFQCLAIALASGVHCIVYREDWTYSEEIERVYRRLATEFDLFSSVAELE
jgi:dCMP deaminase